MDEHDWHMLQEWLDAAADPNFDLNGRRAELHILLRHVVEQIVSNRELINRIIELKHDNRLTVATQLHDGPLQELNAATNIFQQNISDSPSMLALKDESLEYIACVQSSLQDIRRILLENNSLLSPGKSDLVSQLREAIRLKQERGGAIRLTIDDDPAFLRMIRPDMSKVILHFVQETITNARKHGGANQLEVSIFRQDDGVVILTADNGCGFVETVPAKPSDLQVLADKGHLGLRIIAEMAVPFSGHLNVEPKDAKLGGALVQLTLKFK